MFYSVLMEKRFEHAHVTYKAPVRSAPHFMGGWGSRLTAEEINSSRTMMIDPATGSYVCKRMSVDWKRRRKENGGNGEAGEADDSSAPKAMNLGTSARN